MTVHSIDIHFDAVKALSDWEAELMGGAYSEKMKFEGAPENGSALPPADIDSALTYFIAVRAGSHSRFVPLADYTRRCVYEAINGHRDYANGTPIASWATRAKYDKNELIRVFDALRNDVMVM